MYNGPWIFQQDDASSHKTSNTKKWTEGKKGDLLDCSAKCADLNRIENMFGVVAHRVYSNASQFDIFIALKAFVLDERSNFDLQTC